MEDVVAGNPLARDLDDVVTRMAALWEELRGARLFMTGGTGFFGCWLLETLLWANDRLNLGASIAVLTRNPSAFAHKAPHLCHHRAVTLHAGDVRTFEPPAGSFSHVIHGAVDSTVASSSRDRVRIFDVIVDGTRHTLEFARRCGARRFLLTSSGAVYGKQPSDLTHVPEDHPGAPDPTDSSAAYGEGKRAAEMLCGLYADAHLQPTIARGFAFVGPFLPLDAHFAVGNFIRDGMAGGPVRVLSDGTAYRSYMYGSDLATWLWTILLRGEPMRPYNVGSPSAVTIGQLAQLVAAACDPPVQITVARTPAPGAAPERYVPTVTRAESELGLRITVPLADGIRRTIDWHAFWRRKPQAGAAMNERVSQRM
jgi:dTDP-glucose 4,6-dehydratase